jgi:hypothetical protein
VVNLSNIRSEFPSAEGAISRFERLLDEKKGKEYPIEHLFELIEPGSLAVLAELLCWLTDHRYMRRVIRVVSPKNQGGLADYQSFADVPDSIVDELDMGEEIEVTDNMIQIFYRVESPGA